MYPLAKKKKKIDYKLLFEWKKKIRLQIKIVMQARKRIMQEMALASMT